ncbi:biotin--[acetyl-CoA-carboxylase] ligase [Lewinella sp. JB7]|uniref:biotin--[acetyl-CoA-carboxylase] ligase n=1 Tax=Lewinella sp. JB7 TaxID=2962887 RepID=UPI0020C96FFE|nr:biotin--[acetyl-CoA-carboxylase] ligase [Lewinella sp. JB7]MCP9235828.1 biotin--[acetyl-CoA-carboxylase] ligase [Lewinella sp. JB7]
MLIPKVARHFARVASTNSAMLQALAAGEGLADGAVFTTDEQFAGRGQGSNFWHATPGDNLTLSVLLRPDHLSVDRLFVLTEFISIAVADTVRRFLPADLGTTVRTKWPNDIYVGDRKIAGILIQNGLRGSTVQWSVAGIGLNVNEMAFPPVLNTTATSLRQLTGGVLDLERVRDTLFSLLREGYSLTLPGRQALLSATYLRGLYRLGQWSRFRNTDTEEDFAGYITGVSREGRLELTLADGLSRAFDLRALRMLISPP